MSVARSSNLTSKFQHSAFLWSALLTPITALGYPDGAPWGSAVPDAQENCAGCHFSRDPITNSADLLVEGLPEQVDAGANYEFVLSLNAPDMAVGGFQIVIDASSGESGLLSSADDDLEFAGAAIRSTQPQPSESGFVRWTLSWQAPHILSGPIYLYAAVIAANGDQSPFDDIIHYRSYRLTGRTTDP